MNCKTLGETRGAGNWKGCIEGHCVRFLKSGGWNGLRNGAVVDAG